jgi:hypothetical protein
VSLGEQYCESGTQGWPLVTLWPSPAQVHRTVSPVEMLTVLGVNERPGPTITSTIVPIADGTPLTAGWPFSSTMRMPGAPRCFWGSALVRLPPDSARTRNVIVKMIASQKMNRPAVLNFFIVLTLLLCASVIGILFYIEPHLNALRFNAGVDIAQEFPTKPSRIFWEPLCLAKKR